jgi:hypothetical protein
MAANFVLSVVPERFELEAALVLVRLLRWT